jgi:LysM domain
LVTRLERYVYLAVATLALCAALLAASPAEAQAQAAPAKKDMQQVAERVVVRPGDSLWAISSERLGADATSQQITDGAERIYALNRDRIGPDPNILFPGQELTVPAADPLSATAREAAGPTTAAGGEREAARAAKTVEQPANLPKAPEAVPVPTAESPASDVKAASSPVASFLKTVRSSVETAVVTTAQTFAEVRATADGRRQLGLGIIALTFLLGGLMAWKLPMKRRVGESEEWGIYSGYAYAGGYGYYAYRERTPGLHGDTAAGAPVASEPELHVNGSEAEAPATEEGLSRAGLGAIARARRERIRGSRRAARLKRLPRRGSAASVYSPEVRSSLRGSVAGTRLRTPRNGRAKTARQINGGR